MAKRNPGGGNRTAYCSFCRKSYRDVGPLVEGPGDVYICGECVELCQIIIDQEKRRRSGKAPRLLSPEDLPQRLLPYAPGQGEACRVLATAGFRRGDRGGAKEGQGAVLLLGSSRASKVLLARALAHLLELPFAHGDAAAPLDGNPTGPTLPGTLFRLLEAADFDTTSAGRGIVYLDGVDRVAGQRALLEVLGRKEPLTLIVGKPLDTSGILFLCGGAFAGLGEVMARRGRHPEQPVTPDDLLAFGMLPELVRRLEDIITLAPLDEETLTRVVSAVDIERLAGAEG